MTQDCANSAVSGGHNLYTSVYSGTMYDIRGVARVDMGQRPNPILGPYSEHVNEDKMLTPQYILMLHPSHHCSFLATSLNDIALKDTGRICF